MPDRPAPKKALIVATGTDIVEIDRIRQLLDRQGERFLRRVFLPAERRYCMRRTQPAESLAARFAAKEAVMKCLGTGWSKGIAFSHIEVTRAVSGAVGVRLHAAAAVRADHLGISRIHLSVSHTETVALAFVVAEAT